MDIDESMRTQVVEQLARLLSDDRHPSGQRRTCFLRWAEPDHPLLLKWLQSGYLSSDDFRAVMTSAIDAECSPALVIVVADSLADRQRHGPMLQILLSKRVFVPCADCTGSAAIDQSGSAARGMSSVGLPRATPITFNPRGSCTARHRGSQRHGDRGRARKRHE